ncbi:hypothetical protein VTL71DRAFT_9519, partial [Oculimacula yallundae]
MKDDPYKIDGEFCSSPTRFINYFCDPDLRIFTIVAYHQQPYPPLYHQQPHVHRILDRILHRITNQPLLRPRPSHLRNRNRYRSSTASSSISSTISSTASSTVSRTTNHRIFRYITNYSILPHNSALSQRFNAAQSI